MERKRIAYLDIARALLIFMVVFAHSDLFVVQNTGVYPFYWISRLIYTFHMPAFFLISGILLEMKGDTEISFGKFVLHKLRTLLIPYLFFEVIGAVFHLLVLGDSFLVVLKNIVTVQCNVPANWFLIALFLGEVCYFLLWKANYKKYKFLQIIPIGCLVLVYAFAPKLGHYGIVVARGLVAFFFIWLGAVLCKTFTQDKSREAIYVILFSAITVILSVINGMVDLYACQMGNLLCYVLGAVCGTFSILGISRWLENYMIVKPLTYIGMNSLTIMGVHQLSYFLIVKLPFSWAHKSGVIVAFGLALLFSAPFVVLCDRLLPWCIGRKKR